MIRYLARSRGRYHGVSVLPRTIEARIESVPDGTGKGYKTYRCLILSDASGVEANSNGIYAYIYIYVPLSAGKSLVRGYPKISLDSSPSAIPSELIIRAYTRVRNE